MSPPSPPWCLSAHRSLRGSAAIKEVWKRLLAFFPAGWGGGTGGSDKSWGGGTALGTAAEHVGGDNKRRSAAQPEQ